jgi:uncharacterized protein
VDSVASYIYEDKQLFVMLYLIMEFILVSLVFILAGIGAEVVGFGISAISMALLPLFLPLEIAIPLVAIISVVATGVVAYRTKAAGLEEFLVPLFIGSVFGIPLGIYFLEIVPEKILLLILGIILIFSSVYSLVGKEIKLKFDKFTGIMVSFLTGIFGASVNVNGPLVGMYFTTNENISKVKNKDLITTYMFFTGLFVVLGHYLVGRIDREVGIYTLVVLPALFIGLQLGKVIFDKVSVYEINKRYIVIKTRVITPNIPTVFKNRVTAFFFLSSKNNLRG